MDRLVDALKTEQNLHPNSGRVYASSCIYEIMHMEKIIAIISSTGAVFRSKICQRNTK